MRVACNHVGVSLLRPEPTIAKPVPKRGALKTEKSNAFWSSFRLVRLMMSKVNLLKQSFSPNVHMMQHTGWEEGAQIITNHPRRGKRA